MKYSILIPAYKAEYLKKCIDSILSQTFSDFEIIIVNDASPENLDEIVGLYNDERIKYYVNKKNCGAINVVDNWNICLSYAVGDFVICMGDDDELASECLSEYNALMAQYPDLDIYHGRVKVIDENSDFLLLQEARPEFESVYSMMWHRMNGRIQYIGDFLYRRSTLVADGGFYKLPLAWGSDDISAYIAATKKGIANTNKPIFYYRSNSLSITSDKNCKIKLEAINDEYKWSVDFLSNMPESEMDNYYAKMIKDAIHKKMQKKRSVVIGLDMHRGISFVFYWFLHARKYDLSFNVLMRALLISFK